MTTPSRVVHGQLRRRCCLLAPETVAAWSDADCRAWCLGVGMKLHRSVARGGGEASDADDDADVVVGLVEALYAMIPDALRRYENLLPPLDDERRGALFAHLDHRLSASDTPPPLCCVV